MKTPPLYKGQTGDWEVVIGLEVHAQVKSKSKLFSRSSTSFGSEPNSQVSFIDAGFPGMLPVINKVCIQQAIRTGLGLNAVIHKHSLFDRKNYFYADLPQGYQISQYKNPLVGEGYLDIDLEEGGTRRIGIERLHLEQDAGKSLHDQHPSKSYIDLNRAGIALMEIVTKPDLRSPEEAAEFVRKLRALLRCLDTCDGNMEQGNLRADVNVSLHRPGEPFGTRAEIKNINSMRFIVQAAKYEIQRQMEILESGGTVEQETRLFDSQTGKTRAMRSKEDAHDYRYFPDPDLPPLVLADEEIEDLRHSLPELPDAKKKRFIEQFGLKPYEASVLTAEAETALFFEEALKHLSQDFSLSPEDIKNSPKLLSNWIAVELFALLNKENLDFQSSRISPFVLAELISLIQKGTLSGRMAKDVLVEMAETGQPAGEIVQKRGLEQVSDTSVLEEAIEKVLRENPKMVEDYRSGKDKLFGFFVGQVMKVLQGKANPQGVNDLLKKKL